VRPVIYCPFCDVEYAVPVYTDGTRRWYDLHEAQAMADRHIKSHAVDCTQEIEEWLSNAT
jgi:hypothetical protein